MNDSISAIKKQGGMKKKNKPKKPDRQTDICLRSLPPSAEKPD